MSYLPQFRLENPQTTFSHYLQGLHACNDYFACKLKVEGKGSIKVQPDTAIIIIGVTTENIQLKLAQAQNTIKVNEIINTLTTLGISSDNIETQSYTIEPQYDYIDGKQVFRSFKVAHSLKITIEDMDMIGEIIDEAVKSGANTVHDISFIVSEPSKYYQQALTAAIDDALVKAIAIGRKLKINVSQIPVRIIEESYQNSSPIQPFLLQAAGSTTPIQIGQVEITARIETVFTYTRI